MTRLGFSGSVFPVNPKYETLHGLPCHVSVTAIPGSVDVALIFVPKAALPAVLEECGAKGVKGAVILASGFSETGEAGRALEVELRRIADRHGVAICGPNCLGLANLASGFMGLTAATFPADMSAGRTALISQSGQLMMVLLARAHDQGLHLRQVVSTGNELNVEASDYARLALADPEVTSVALVIEGLKNADNFLAVSGEAQDAGKPLIVLKLGRSERAARTALAHTGKMAGAHRSYAAVFRQRNVVAVDDPLELADVAALFEKCPAPQGERVSVVTFSGGWCGVVADQAEAHGVTLAEFTDETAEALRPLLDFTPPVNPLDLSGNVNNHPERWGASLRAALADANTDILVVFIHQVRAEWRDRLIGPLLEIAQGGEKPILVVYDGGKVVEAGWEALARDRTLPIFRGSRPMLRALRRFLDWHARARRPEADDAPPEIPADASARADAILASSAGLLHEHAAKAALAAYGLPMVAERLAPSCAAALEAAEDLGWPVALKGLADGLEHKTDAGLVHLGLSRPEEVAAAHDALAAALKGRSLADGPAQILVQRMEPPAVEAIIGMSRDPDFGPMIMLGSGGVMTELFDDVALRRAPLTRSDVAEMIDETRLGVLLSGFRGRPKADRRAFEDMVLRLSAFAVDHAATLEGVDVNPVFVRPEGHGCVAVDALIVKRGKTA
jgi:acyl-CoA synthetase (NDP forming)